jgi:hypothetical protein
VEEVDRGRVASPAGEVQVGEPDAATTSSDDITSTLDAIASFLPSSRSS